MPRYGRVALAHYPHHLVQRGHDRQCVFLEPGDFHAYLDTLGEFRRALGIKVYAYCLMTNHVHLIIDPGADARNLGRLMRRLAGRHTRRLNRRKQSTGTAWDGRYKCSPIETDRYLLACSRYVELNPVRAGLTARPDEYLWSSFRAKVGLAVNELIDPDPCYLGLDAAPAVRAKRYAHFVSEGVEDTELDVIRSAVERNQLTGTGRLLDVAHQQLGRRVSNRGPGRPSATNERGPEKGAKKKGTDLFSANGK